MTITEKKIALRAINELQQQIEAFEASWKKAYDNGDETSEIDETIDRLLSKRRGMETMLNELDIAYVRRDWIEDRGLQCIPHTSFRLA